MMTVTEAIVQKRDIVIGQRTGTAQEIEHFSADLLVRSKDAQCAYSKSRRRKGTGKRCFRQSFHLGKTLGQCRKCKGFLACKGRCREYESEDQDKRQNLRRQTKILVAS